MTHSSNAIAVLMGPTGTGKSALAIRVAQTRPTVIINADAMQMVADLRIITARPSMQEEAQAEHALYGVLPAREPTSVMRWLAWVIPVIEGAWAQGKLPLLVGGTGMYVHALRHGIAAMPEVPDSIRQRVRSMDAPMLYAELTARGAAQGFKPGDTQRLARALEVLETSGKTIQWWQAQPTVPPLPTAHYHTGYLHLPRDQLYTRLDTRFAAMIDTGVLQEIKALMAQDLPAGTPVLRAHGVPELMAHLGGELPLADAVAKAQQNTRNYAKRQETWLRHQPVDAIALDAAAPDAAFFTKA